MKLPRVIAVLLMVLEWIHLGVPSPLRPICDPRVLDRFIKEARDTEVAMRSCTEGCSVAEPLSVPLTSVDFAIWERQNAEEKAQDVQSGLWLLSQAIAVVRSSVTSATLRNLLDNNHSNIYNIGQVIRSLNFQEYTPPTGGTSLEDIWHVSTTSELLRVHTNFLRGKVRLLLASAAPCRHGSS